MPQIPLSLSTCSSLQPKCLLIHFVCLSLSLTHADVNLHFRSYRSKWRATRISSWLMREEESAFCSIELSVWMFDSWNVLCDVASRDAFEKKRVQPWLVSSVVSSVVQNKPSLIMSSREEGCIACPVMSSKILFLRFSCSGFRTVSQDTSFVKKSKTMSKETSLFLQERISLLVFQSLQFDSFFSSSSCDCFAVASYCSPCIPFAFMFFYFIEEISFRGSSRLILLRVFLGSNITSSKWRDSGCCPDSSSCLTKRKVDSLELH